MRPRSTFLAGACAAVLACGAGAQAAGRETGQAHGDRAGTPAKLTVLHRPTEHFHRSVEVFQRRVQRRRAARTSATGAGAGVSSPEELGVSQATLDGIAACESGGDPTAVSADGTYRGKYQFDYGTWASVGGSGDPAAAPEAEQDMRAAMLYARAGSSPWPICG